MKLRLKIGLLPKVIIAIVADFVIPLCATIHLSGSMLKIVACAFAVRFMRIISVFFDLSLNNHHYLTLIN